MLFINPMWDNESERIGKQRCSPLGYALHVISDMIGIVGLLALLVTIGLLAYRGIIGSFHLSMLWLLTIPFGIGVVGSILYRISWILARRRGFAYDGDSRTASWLENGQIRTYCYAVKKEP